ncbi:MAG: hypothetical protein C4562_04700 [Actinobacteria bacterium]|nr:MAG: hypothetical protein C4562_04700 [Actinomycetota bacterium]
MIKDKAIEILLDKLADLILKPFISIILTVIIVLITALFAYILEYGTNFMIFVVSTVAITTGSFIGWLRIYFKYGRLNEQFGVYWDRDYNLRCLHCKSPLKNSSANGYTFFCSDPDCNNKHILKDEQSKYIEKHEAVEIMNKQKGKRED